MADAITIPEDRTPSYLNRYGFTGAKVGALGVLAIAIPFAGFFAGATGFTAAVITGLAGGTVIGACSSVGCIRGKEAIARNQVEGRLVNPPSMLNEGTAQGLLNGALVGLGAYAVAAIAGAAAPIALIIGGLGVGVTAAAGYMQGKQYQEKMAVEYDNAKSKAAELQQGMMGQLMEQFAGKDKGKITAPEIDRPDIEAKKVTKEDMAEIRRKQEDGRHKGVRDWAEKIQEMNEDKAESREASLA